MPAALMAAVDARGKRPRLSRVAEQMADDVLDRADLEHRMIGTKSGLEGVERRMLQPRDRTRAVLRLRAVELELRVETGDVEIPAASSSHAEIQDGDAVRGSDDVGRNDVAVHGHLDEIRLRHRPGSAVVPGEQFAAIFLIERRACQRREFLQPCIDVLARGIEARRRRPPIPCDALKGGDPSADARQRELQGSKA